MTPQTATPDPEPTPVLQTLDFRPETLDCPRPDTPNFPAPETQDGAKRQHRKIASRLQQSTDPPLPYPISEMDLSRWKNGGYLRYLAAQEHIESLSADRETALDMVAADDTTTLPEATLQIIAGQYFQFLGGFNPESLKAKLAEDPLKYTRFLNVFARLSRKILLLKKHRQAAAQTALAELKPRDPDRNLNDKEFRSEERRVGKE